MKHYRVRPKGGTVRWFDFERKGVRFIRGMHVSTGESFALPCGVEFTRAAAKRYILRVISAELGKRWAEG